MKSIVVNVISVICAIAAVIGIKMMGLPTLITILLVLIVLTLLIYSLIGGPTKNKSTEKRSTKIRTSVPDNQISSEK
jgi:purine-cytosine permease-like protein